eukprot:gnl/MRDRNA2_/MRDRNA2_86344_c0_seq1.p1 gnl/MRDRNA2_/MRDRNA2_86344_c0~~gnl/MRDRNA2_/MRDRNA2_86344_c0_seq1.p1  ORF type:complete len:422 (+),score=94.96 gnl/MRDRNA2_/MRDRNA2_86344_c0_seq1:83-1348(+)
MMKAAVLSLLLVACGALNLDIEKPKKTDLEEEVVKAKDQISNEKLTNQELAKRTFEHTTGKMRDVGPLSEYIDFWYVNLKDSRDRRDCMDRQIGEMGMKPHRFAAYSFKRCRDALTDDIQTCLVQKKYGDCVKSGVNWGSVKTHGSASNTELERMYKIVSNWCSHKRMMAYMLKKRDALNTTEARKPKYAVILEDDVAFDRHDFLRKVVNFAETYDGKYSEQNPGKVHGANQTWQMVQIDPFGSKCDKHIVGYFEGLPVWKPRNANGGWECSNYWGAQALLVKYSEIPNIIKHMEDHQTVPLDWLPAHLPGGLALRANIALNPEASRSVHMRVPMPQYCRKSVSQSTIGGFRQKSLGRAMALAEKSGANPLDAAKVVIDPEDADYANLVEKYNSASTPATYSEWMDMKEKARTDLNKYGIK